MKKDAILEELEWLLNFNTPINRIEDETNNLFVKRDDMIPFSFGGNKVRIAANYFIDLIRGDYDAVVTYGASTSNLCRVITAMAMRYEIQCYIVSPEEEYCETPNSVMVHFLGANIEKCPIEKVSETIDETIHRLKKRFKPYFIYGGGHGKIGTDSYRTVLKQIVEYEKENAISFDLIFITLATGTSMSGLVVENSTRNNTKRIIGVSIAREIDRAYKFLNEALGEFKELSFDDDKYLIIDNRVGGYGKYDDCVINTIKHQFKTNALYLDPVYTGKGFSGMMKYLSENEVKKKNVLFVHTGGSPLFFLNNCELLKG